MNKEVLLFYLSQKINTQRKLIAVLQYVEITQIEVCFIVSKISAPLNKASKHCKIRGEKYTWLDIHKCSVHLSILINNRLRNNLANFMGK